MKINDAFAEFWSRYPRKEGKKRALAVFFKLGNEGHALDSICLALDNYIKLLGKERRELKYMKHAETFLRNYEDYLEDLTPTQPEGGNAELARRVLSGNL